MYIIRITNGKEKIMKKDIGMRVRDKFLPYLIFPSIVGVLTGVLIFIFKVTASFVMHKSFEVYSYAQENPKYIPLIILAACLIGCVSAFLLKWAKDCRGGGIPTAVATIRDLIPLRWIQCIFGLFASSMLTFLGGVPLGNEGPSVQMGTAVGKGTTKMLGKRYRAWERYNMTGGASAGFAVATGAPLSGIVFAMEEIHRRFSPPILIVAAISVITATATAQTLSGWCGIDSAFINFEISEVLPLRFLWIAVLIGIVCGICANLLTKLYHLIRNKAKASKFKIPFVVNVMLIFTVVGALGVACVDFVGSGHSLIEHILERRTVWYIVLIAFVIRAILMIVANVSGVSGGLFVPTLALGAMVSSLLADALIALGIIGEEYYAILVVVGIASFLSAASRIPLTALTFAAEALCVVNNILPVVAGVIIAYLTVEIIGNTSFADTVIEAKSHDAHAGKTPTVVDCRMMAEKGSFAVGMEVRDILWPPTCTVLSVDKSNSSSRRHSGMIEAGDVLHLHYLTYDSADTLELLAGILGDQDEDDSAHIRAVDDNHIVPGH